MGLTVGDARGRRALGLPPRGLKASTLPTKRDCLTLAMIDRRMEQLPGGETRFEDHSAKPGVYGTPGLKRFYHWDGKMLRRLDSNPFQSQNTDADA